MVVVLVLAGLAWWTLAEYLLHRFAFHLQNPLFGRRHALHHARMAEWRWVVAPPASALGGLAVQALIVRFGFGPGAWPVFFGIAAGYVIYEATHYTLHFRKARTRAGRWLQRHHFAHHQQTPDARFGVTSPLWDWVFRTLPPGR